MFFKLCHIYYETLEYSSKELLLCVVVHGEPLEEQFPTARGMERPLQIRSRGAGSHGNSKTTK